MEEQVYKVWHTLIWQERNYGHFITDLQYDNGIPYAVFEWLNTYEGEVPSVRIELNPIFLHKSKGGGATHLYEMPLVWPKDRPPKIINQDTSRRVNSRPEMNCIVSATMLFISACDTTSRSNSSSLASS